MPVSKIKVLLTAFLFCTYGCIEHDKVIRSAITPGSEKKDTGTDDKQTLNPVPRPSVKSTTGTTVPPTPVKPNPEVTEIQLPEPEKVNFKKGFFKSGPSALTNKYEIFPGYIAVHSESIRIVCIAIDAKKTPDVSPALTEAIKNSGVCDYKSTDLTSDQIKLIVDYLNEKFVFKVIEWPAKPGFYTFSPLVRKADMLLYCERNKSSSVKICAEAQKNAEDQFGLVSIMIQEKADLEIFLTYLNK